MSSEKLPNTTNLIREIKTLARLADELSTSAREMGAELEQLQQMLGIEQCFGHHVYPGCGKKPN